MSKSISLKNRYVADGIAAIWYGWLFGLAGRLRHSQSVVVGKELWRGIDLYFHVMGGNLDRKTRTNTMELSTHGGIDLQAWSEPGMLHLPRRINRFADRESNRQLYYWLAAVLAADQPQTDTIMLPPGVRHMLNGVSVTTRLLQEFPGLEQRYQKLCEQELRQRRTAYRDPIGEVNSPALVLESAIRAVLQGTYTSKNESLRKMIVQAKAGEAITPAPEWVGKTVPFLPVPLWPYRKPAPTKIKIPWFRATRKPNQDSEPKPQKKADFNPDYLPDPNIGIPAIPDHYLYPEWNCFTRSYQKNWCRLIEQLPKGGYRAELDSQFSEMVHRVQRSFKLLRQEPQWKRLLEDGPELDIDSYIDTIGDRRALGSQETNFFREKSRQFRDISVIVLMDASRSTEAWLDNVRVIDIAKQSLAVLAQVLHETGDKFALYSFSSDSRLRVRCDRIKTFDQPYDEKARRNLLEVKPRNYTRLGPLVRHLGAILHGRSSRQKLLLILSDGKPHDPTDRYEGRYALEDTRKALIEQRSRNIECFGLTINQDNPRYLKYLFGAGNYAVYSHLHSLPDVLPSLYAKVTNLQSL